MQTCLNRDVGEKGNISTPSKKIKIINNYPPYQQEQEFPYHSPVDVSHATMEKTDGDIRSDR